MKAQNILQSRWTTGVRKALGQLFGAAGAKRQGIRQERQDEPCVGRTRIFTKNGPPSHRLRQSGSAASGGNEIPGPAKSHFWSDFCRESGNSQDNEQRSAGAGEKLLNILVPFDFTTSSFTALECALRMAQKMAQSRGAQVTLLHAIYINLSPYGPANLALIKEDMRQAAKAKISQVVALARLQNVAAKYVVSEGKPAVAIGNFLKEQPADLVILGCHRHRGLRWFGWQKTAEKVIREAPCPVLVLQTDKEERILV